eukprot:15360387-Ditylum_brightwellii.AAC.2
MEQENTVEPTHPLCKLHPNEKGYDAVSAKESCRKYLVDFLATQHCHCPKGMGQRETKCSCLSFMKEDSATVEVDCVANYMLHWAGLTGPTQNELFGNWIRMAPAFAQQSQDKKKCFVLPLQGKNSNLIAPRMVCQNAMFGVLYIGRVKFESIKQGKTEHGLKNCVGTASCRGKKAVDWREYLKQYFEGLKSNECTPFATRVIRELTGTTTRDDDPDNVALPPHMGKRKVYERWCYERGWVAKRKQKALSSYYPIEEFQQRQHDDEEENPQ